MSQSSDQLSTTAIRTILSPEQIEIFLAGPLKALTESLQVEPDMLRFELAQIRRLRYADVLAEYIMMVQEQCAEVSRWMGYLGSW